MTSLNPCFTGIYSLRARTAKYIAKHACLNPCFTGIYSLRRKLNELLKQCDKVLILVLLEYTL